MDKILKFKPVLKSAIWGGTRIADFKGIEINDDHIGESWELSPMPGNESLVADGQYAGKSLPELIREYGKDIMGERLLKKYGAFPLLIKFIDSNDDLSIQVHPDDKLAKERHDSLGKTEMWYSLRPEPGAYLYSGFSRKTSPDDFKRQIADNTITDSLARHETKAGDVFYLPAGRVHSIGKGNLILEVQEASDITYRIYDFDRRDKDGKPRQLHIEEAECAINFDDLAEGPAPNIAAKAGERQTLCESPYFSVQIAGIDGEEEFDLSSRDSFTVLIAIEGAFEVDAPGQSLRLGQGETALVPEVVSKVKVRGKGDLVSVFLP